MEFSLSEKTVGVIEHIIDNADKLPMAFAMAAIAILCAGVCVLTICIVCQIIILTATKK